MQLLIDLCSFFSTLFYIALKTMLYLTAQFNKIASSVLLDNNRVDFLITGSIFRLSMKQ